MDTGNPELLRFGAFELDLRQRELRKGAARVRLQEQPLAILCLMLERPGEIVTREQLRQRLWPEGTFVDFEHSLNAAVKRLRAALGDEAESPTFVETVPRRGYRFIAPLQPRVNGAHATAGASPRVRLAVLPFVNLSDDPAQDFFSDGLTEETIAQLGQLYQGRVGVISRWSSMAFRGTSARAREIGDALRVSYLVEGSVRREGDRVRVAARLIQAADETQLWAATYERHLTDCLSVQAELAAQVARSLAVEIAPDAASRTRQPSCDPLAYQIYLKGRYHWNKPFDQGLDESIAFYEQAIAMAPRFGAAHAALARAHIGSAEYYRTVPRQALKCAEASARRALELDSSLYEAYLAQGDVRRLHDYDWAAAEQAYLAATAANPSGEAGHRQSAILYSLLGRHEEATREIDRAFELDPMCIVVGTSGGWVHYAAGNYDTAITRCQYAIDLDPTFVGVRRLLAAACLQAGRLERALAELRAAAAAHGGNPLLLLWLAHAEATAGSRTRAEALIDEAKRLGRECYVAPYHLALAYVGLGELDAAFESLEQAWLDRDPSLPAVHVEPRFEPLRADDRYAGLLGKLNLSDMKSA